jgi:hypothetical protein
MTVTLDLDTGSGGLDDTSSYTENGGNITLFGSASVSSGTDAIESVSLAIDNYDGSEVLCLSSTPSGQDVFWNGALGILTLSASDITPADSVWQTALNNVRYQDALNDAPSPTRTITVTANGFNSDATATETINVTRVNDFPTVDITPTDYNTTEQTSLNLKGTGIVVNDLDAGSAAVSLELKVTEGNDTLTGGLGIDDLTGGLGSDTFKFNKKDEAPKGLVHDSITDFSGFGNEGDHINLHTMDANTFRHGNQNFKFIGSNHFHHTGRANCIMSSKAPT